MTGLRLHQVSKRYGTLQALRDVSLDFAAGEVHAVLGENGAGKSTLVNVVAGLVAPDAGRTTLNGVDLPKGDPIAARRAGLGVVHQHFTLVPGFTVAENIALFRLRSGGRFDVGKLAEPALEKARQLGWQIDPSARVASLPVGTRQRIEILKSLCDDEAVILFDEPTAPLSPDEVQDLLGVLRRLAAEGRVVVLIAHKLREVLAVADRVSVLRRGTLQAAGLSASDVTADDLARLMVGDLPTSPETRPRAECGEGLQVHDLIVFGDSRAPAVRGATFAARRGEIFGIGGVDGNGQVELAEALSGIRAFTGSIRLEDRAPTSVAYIPADRQVDGLALGMTVAENLLLGRLAAWPARKEVRPWVEGLLQRYEVRASGPDQDVAELSGGNQQKLVVARTLDREPEVVVAVNPTRGLDLKASAFVYDRLRIARDNGSIVVLVSADLDELYSIADRVAFMSGGVLTEAKNASAFLGGTS